MFAWLAGSARAAVLDPGPPSIDSVSVSQVTSKRATLVASIDPDQLVTTYEFWLQYNACQNAPPGYAECYAITVSKVGEGTIAAGSSPQWVSVELKQLQPGYRYDYWVVATNSVGSSKGGGGFQALPSPTVESESVSGRAPEPITLEATIDPNGQAVYYQFQLVSNTSEYASEPECPVFEVVPMLPACTGEYAKGALPIGRLEAGDVPQKVSLDLAGAGVPLKVGSTYHYRVIVAPSVQTEDTIEWDGPPTLGADRSFTVGEDNVSPVATQPPVGDDAVSPSAGGGANPQTQVFVLPHTHVRWRPASLCRSRGPAARQRARPRRCRRAGPARPARRRRRHRSR
jgi:hypothetical protein